MRKGYNDKRNNNIRTQNEKHVFTWLNLWILESRILQMSIQVKRRVEWNKSPWFPPQVLRAGPEAAWGKYKSEHHVFTRSTEFCVDGHWGHRGTENTVLWLQLRLLNLLLHMLLHSIHNLQDIQWHPSIPSIWNYMKLMFIYSVHKHRDFINIYTNWYICWYNLCVSTS